MNDYRSDIIMGYASLFHDVSTLPIDELMNLPLHQRNTLNAHGLLTVAATNVTLAVELSLKAIHAILSVHNKPVKGHDLVKLFETLPKFIQVEIEERYNHLKADWGGPAEAFSITEGNIPDETSIRLKYTNDLKTLLETHRKGFIDWRYNFEENEDPEFVVDYFSLSYLYQALAETGRIHTQFAIAKMEFYKQNPGPQI